MPKIFSFFLYFLYMRNKGKFILYRSTFSAKGWNTLKGEIDLSFYYIGSRKSTNLLFFFSIAWKKSPFWTKGWNSDLIEKELFLFWEFHPNKEMGALRILLLPNLLLIWHPFILIKNQYPLLGHLFFSFCRTKGFKISLN